MRPCRGRSLLGRADGRRLIQSGARGAADAVVLGVSPDPVAAVKRLHEKHGLGFTLLADERHEVAERYRVRVERQIRGRTSFGAERTTFVIGPDGRIERVLRRVKPGEHDKLVLAA